MLTLMTEVFFQLRYDVYDVDACYVMLCYFMFFYSYVQSKK